MRSTTRPDKNPDRAAAAAPARRPVIGSPQPLRGEDAGGIGAGAEKRGVAQGHDAGIAEHQIGRQREQDRRQDLRAQCQIVGKDEICRDRRQPRQCFERVVAVPARQTPSTRAARRSCAAEQAARPPQQNRHRQRIDEKCAEFRQQVFEAGVGDAEQQCRDKRPANAAEPADRHDDQEIGEVLQRVARIDRQQVGAEPAAQTGEPAAQGKGQS